MANTPNEAIASLKTRQDAIEAINSLYGTFDTDTGKNFLMDILEQNHYRILDWLPDDVLIELAKLHAREEWKGYPWK